MPRISADSVAEHVAQQEAAVLNAALELFLERGYEHVTLADIAARIGLARNSLYRYFPDKAHILLRWLDDEVPRQVARTRTILARPGTPLERIISWAEDQIAYAREPEHQLLSRISSLVPDLDAAARTHVGAVHQQLTQPLRQVLAEAGVPDEQQALVADMVQSLAFGIARHTEASSGQAEPARAGLGPSAPALRYLHHAVAGLLNGDAVGTGGDR